MRHGIPLVLAALLLASCATTPTYDAQATELLTRIVAKEKAGEKVQPRADRPPPPEGFGAVGQLIGKALQGETSVTVYAYTVMDPSGKPVRVLSEYPAFEAGDCVVLFQSSQPTYPRLARGSGCR